MMSPSLRTIAPAVHVAESPQRFLGLEVGSRMTVLSLQGGLLVHSPIAMDPAALAHLGVARWALAPNLFHHLHAGPWAAAGLALWGAAGLPEKRPDISFAGILAADDHPFGSEVAVHPLSCFPMSNEVVVLHRPSGTLITTDLVFHFTAGDPWLTRTAMACLGGYPGCRTTVLERFGMDREAARRDLSVILSWDFDRLVMAHGAVIERGGREALRQAFAWLGPLG